MQIMLNDRSINVASLADALTWLVAEKLATEPVFVFTKDGFVVWPSQESFNADGPVAALVFVA